MKTKFLITVSMGLILAGSAWAGPPKAETQDAEPEKVEALEFQIPEKVIAEPSENEQSKDAEGHELTHTVQQKSDTGDTSHGMPTGKRQHKPLAVTKHVDKATPKAMNDAPDTGDAEDGMATGKNKYEPIRINKRIDSSSPMMTSPEPGDTSAMNKGEVISEIASEPDMPDKPMSFEDAVGACRSAADLQACVDKKTGQAVIRELDKSSTK